MDVMDLYHQVRKADRNTFLGMLKEAKDEELIAIQNVLELLRVELDGKLKAKATLAEKARVDGDNDRLSRILEEISQLQTGIGWTKWKEVALRHEFERRFKRAESLAEQVEQYLLKHA